MATLGPFCPLLDKNEFSQKLGCQFFDFTIIYTMKKKKKKKTIKRQLEHNYTEEKTKSQIVNTNVRKQVLEIVIMSNGFDLTIFNQP